MRLSEVKKRKHFFGLIPGHYKWDRVWRWISLSIQRQAWARYHFNLAPYALDHAVKEAVYSQIVPSIELELKDVGDYCESPN